MPSICEYKWRFRDISKLSHDPDGRGQKTLSPSIQARNVVKGVSRTLIEYIRSGIRYITILPIFGIKTTSFP